MDEITTIKPANTKLAPINKRDPTLRAQRGDDGSSWRNPARTSTRAPPLLVEQEIKSDSHNMIAGASVSPEKENPPAAQTLEVQTQTEIKIDVEAPPARTSPAPIDDTPRSVKFGTGLEYRLVNDYTEFQRSSSAASTCSARSRIDSMEYD